MTEVRVEPRRPWYVTWFWRSLVLLGLGLGLTALGEVRALAASGGGPAPVLPDYALLLPNIAVFLGSMIALVGAAMALVSICAASLHAVRRWRGGSRPD